MQYQKKNKILHRINAYCLINANLVRQRRGLVGLWDTPDDFPSWKIAMTSFPKPVFQIVEESKFCRIVRHVDEPYWENFIFLADTRSRTVEQAVYSTKIGIITLTHNK